MNEIIEECIHLLEVSMNNIGNKPESLKFYSCKDIIRETNRDPDNPTYQAVRDAYRPLRDVIGEVWKSCLDSFANHLYGARWVLVDVLSDKGMNHLNQAYHRCMAGARYEGVIDKFHAIKITKGLTTEEYSEAITRYDSFIDDHVTSMKSLLEDIRVNIIPVIVELKKIQRSNK